MVEEGLFHRGIASYGSATWRRQAKQAGIEPDNCFYFQNESRVRGKLEFDRERDPPPDSQVFPTLDIPALPQLIESQRSAGRLALWRSVREWVKGQV